MWWGKKCLVLAWGGDRNYKNIDIVYCAVLHLYPQSLTFWTQTKSKKEGNKRRFEFKPAQVAETQSIANYRTTMAWITLTWKYHKFFHNNSLQKYSTILLRNSSSQYSSTVFATQQYFTILHNTSQYFSTILHNTSQYFTILLQKYFKYFSTISIHNTSP